MKITIITGFSPYPGSLLVTAAMPSGKHYDISIRDGVWVANPSGKLGFPQHKLPLSIIRIAQQLFRLTSEAAACGLR